MTVTIKILAKSGVEIARFSNAAFVPQVGAVLRIKFGYYKVARVVIDCTSARIGDEIEVFTIPEKSP